MKNAWKYVEYFFNSGILDALSGFVFICLAIKAMFDGDTETAMLFLIAAKVFSISLRMVEKKR